MRRGEGKKSVKELAEFIYRMDNEMQEKFISPIKQVGGQRARRS